jgi:hypothetical protein
LIERTKRDQSGRLITEFFGEPKTWMAMFTGNRRRALSFRNTSTLS